MTADSLVRWVSGLNQQFAKLSYRLRYRGFESPFHRKDDVAASQMTGGRFCMTAAGNLFTQGRHAERRAAKRLPHRICKGPPGEGQGNAQHREHNPPFTAKTMWPRVNDWRPLLHDGRGELVHTRTACGTAGCGDGMQKPVRTDISSKRAAYRYRGAARFQTEPC